MEWRSNRSDLGCSYNRTRDTGESHTRRESNMSCMHLKSPCFLMPACLWMNKMWGMLMQTITVLSFRCSILSSQLISTVSEWDPEKSGLARWGSANQMWWEKGGWKKYRLILSKLHNNTACLFALIHFSHQTLAFTNYLCSVVMISAVQQ